MEQDSVDDPAELLRHAVAVAPTVLPRAISAAVVAALGDPDWARGYHETLACEVVALTSLSPARGTVYVHCSTGDALTTTSAVDTREVAPGVNVDTNDDGPIGVEVLDAVLVEVDGRPVLRDRITATAQDDEDLIEAAARAICNVGRDHDLWASEVVGESTREDLCAEARAALAALREALRGG